MLSGPYVGYGRGRKDKPGGTHPAYIFSFFTSGKPVVFYVFRFILYQPQEIAFMSNDQEGFPERGFYRFYSAARVDVSRVPFPVGIDNLGLFVCLAFRSLNTGNLIIFRIDSWKLT